MSKRIDIVGHKYNLLTVLWLNSTDKHGRGYYLCKCQCGNTVIVSSDNLRRNHTKSCGCHKINVSKTKNLTHGQSSGENKTIEYKTWLGMKNRCYNQREKSYKYYGGRGIKVCDRWLNSFENFLEDMGKRPHGKFSIDRIDVNGNYEPSNCRWATDYQQRRNKTNNNVIEYNGSKIIIEDLAACLKTTTKVIYDRQKRGVPIDVKIDNKKIVLNLETGIFYDSAKQAAETYNINYNTFLSRIKKSNTNFIYV